MKRKGDFERRGRMMVSDNREKREPGGVVWSEGQEEKKRGTERMKRETNDGGIWEDWGGSREAEERLRQG